MDPHWPPLATLAVGLGLGGALSTCLHRRGWGEAVAPPAPAAATEKTEPQQEQPPRELPQLSEKEQEYTRSLELLAQLTRGQRDLGTRTALELHGKYK